MVLIWPFNLDDEARAKLTFGLCLLLTLTFSQMWVMPITGPVADPDASSVIRNVYFPAYGVAIGLVVLHARAVAAAAVRIPLIWTALALIAASTLWSVDPDVTSRRAIAVTFTTLSGLVIGASLDWLGIARLIAATTLASGVASFLMAVLNPAWGVMHELFPGAWQGVWDSKNLLGEQMSTGFTFCAAAVIFDLPYRKYWVFAGSLAVFLIVMSTSKTALAAVLLGVIAMLFVFAVQRGPVLALTTSWLGGLALIILAVTFFVSPDTLLALLGRDATLSGRTKLWAAALKQVDLHPWTGFGYGAVWGDKSIWGPINWITKDAGFKNTGADDSWVEIALGVGYGGVILFALVMFGAWRRVLVAAFASRGGYVALPFLLVFTLTTLTESIALIFNALPWVMFTAIAVRLSLGEPQPREATP